ncbi:hypothetical protein E5161_06660 [Cohnella pontilimi]|uniref:Uncharacterized protein n=1 Tax=Cohnella pontilimi TaxID=2564100 RepID=A0A4V5LSX2_9BACL|nr:hypothetical protein [Cohnella pontilimi]TJY43549.1 hypothetical protein E5161_06660 [Cohnella pontilimi]
MRRYRVTLFFTLFSVALSLYNYSGYDPHNHWFFMFSIPVWFVELFGDIHRVDVFVMYALTVITWAVIGFLADLGVSRIKTWQHL